MSAEFHKDKRVVQKGIRLFKTKKANQPAAKASEKRESNQGICIELRKLPMH